LRERQAITHPTLRNQNSHSPAMSAMGGNEVYLSEAALFFKFVNVHNSMMHDDAAVPTSFLCMV
jgi:hypothetical protein